MVTDKKIQATEALTENDILFDHSEDLHYVVRRISTTGITLFRDGQEYYFLMQFFPSGIRQHM